MLKNILYGTFISFSNTRKFLKKTEAVCFVYSICAFLKALEKLSSNLRLNNVDISFLKDFFHHFPELNAIEKIYNGRNF